MNAAMPQEHWSEDDYYLDDPDYDDDDPDPECCWHKEYDADFNGRATCYRCGHVWYLTREEMAAEAQRQADYIDALERQERRDRWLGWWDRLVSWLRPSRWRTSPADDEIPF
ncbi:MAG: hypothetical protein IT537_03075 [Hyphomicrobiales bacterium]|nr:hypothetical protein [Hyphomicrobiales bacterium]